MPQFEATPIYAGVLVFANPLVLATVLYTVPANKTLILTEIDLAEGSGGTSSNVSISVGGVNLFDNKQMTPGTTLQWAGRLVVTAGVSILANYLTLSGGAAPSIIISGLVG